VGKVLDGAPRQRIEHAHAILGAQIVQIAIHLLPSSRWVPTAEVAPFRHQEQGRRNPLLSTDGEQLTQRAVGAGGYTKSFEGRRIGSPSVFFPAASVVRACSRKGRGQPTERIDLLQVV